MVTGIIKKLLTQRNIAQLLFLVALAIVFGFIWQNLIRNLQQLGLPFGFNFLKSQASFNIRESPIPFQPSDSYALALLAGLLNTLKVMTISIILATLVGIVVGISRLSNNWLLRQIALVYVEVLRNVPLLLQLFFWYSAIFLTLPQSSDRINLFGIVYLSISGITFPWINASFSSEFCALVLGLTLYTATFISEIVRGGILSIPRGQWEAAKALGLGGGLVMRLVIIPQALRVIVPPLTSQYLNIAKNSSLAVAIGYEDIYSLSSTTFNQTGRSIEVVLLIMATYLGISLILSLIMNLLNRKVQLVER